MYKAATIGLLVLTAGSAVAQDAAHFQRILDPVTKQPALSAVDMTPDGRFIIGSMDTDGDDLPDTGYRWDRLTGEFLHIPTEIIGTGADPMSAISDDGQVILGDIADGLDGIESTAGLWTAETGWVSLGFLPNAGSCPSRSSGYELSGDGTIAVGLSWDECSGRGFIWTAETGMLELENLANGGNRASVMSSDGSVIAGFAQGFTRTPAYWDGLSRDGTVVDPTYGATGEFYGVSDDGSILLGSWNLDDDIYGSAVTLIDGVVTPIGAGSLLPGWGGNPMDISDNDVIVGFDFLLGNRRSWIKPSGQNELMETVSYINSLGAGIPEDTRLEVIQAISTDGKTVIGHTSGGVPAFLITLDYNCPADLTGDGVLDFFDVSDFLDAFAAQDPAADFTNDGLFDFFDVSDFLDAFGAGCP
tara:strand:- start:2369 stop:3616 length:1248 start_codon:yes stop_codon:yes gene_type:complete